MSYRNPQIIVDRSAEIYAQAVGQMGQIWAQGVQNYFENKKKEQAAIDKRNKAYQLGINETQLKYDDSLREALKDVDDESLYELIQAQGEGKLNGSEGSLGVIDMETQLKLNTELTKDQRKEYRTKINDYKRWEDKIVNLSGEVMADLEPLDNLSSSEIGMPGKIEFLGEGNEKFKNYVAAYSLKKKTVPGVETKKTADGDLLNIDISIDTNDPIMKQFINDGALQINEDDIGEDGKVNLKWSRDIKTWDGRFLVDIAEGPDIMKSLETANLVDNGNITRAFMSGTDYRVEDIKGTDYQTITPKNYFNPSIITENETVQSEFEAYAYGQIVSQSIDEAIVSLRSNFGVEVSRKDWAGMNASERQDFVVDLLNDKAIEQAKGSKLATQTELYDRRNNKIVSPSQLKSLAKKANMSEQDYIKQNLEIKYYTLGKSFERKKSTDGEKEVKTNVSLTRIEDYPMEIDIEKVTVIGKKGYDQKIELIDRLVTDMTRDLPGKGVTVKPVEGGGVQFLLGGSKFKTIPVDTATSEDIKKIIYTMYGGDPTKIEGIASKTVPEVPSLFTQLPGN
jgi:hypothetical protein